MECREFEDNLWRYFSNYDFESCRRHSDDWSEFLPVDEFHRSLLSHLATCDDCVSSLLWYLDMKDTVDYREFPCLHLAYFCKDGEDQCLDYMHGLFSVLLDRETRSGIVIGFCPWCGIKLNTSAV